MRAISSSPSSRGTSSPTIGWQHAARRRGREAGALTGFHSLTARLVRLKWPYNPSGLDFAWAAFSAANLAAIYLFEGWETVPFHFIWISFTLLYGFRTWSTGPTVWVLAAVMTTTGTGIGFDVLRGSEPVAELTEVPLMAAMFLAMVWHAHRKQAAEESSRRVSEENARLLATQQQFLQDAAHQLRTPITIALGHAELLAGELTGAQEGQDIEVVIGELNRLRRIAERLLLIAAAEDPGFLRAEPVALDRLIMELIRRWLPTASRRWQLGRLDSVTVHADRERLGLALDALLENAVRHTSPGDVIELSVMRGWPGMPVRIVVADGGCGIPPDQLHLIFDRFRTGQAGQSRGTGLGLPLVRAVARAHGGDVIARSTPGKGSEFQLSLPAMVTRLALPAAPADPGNPSGVTRAAVLESELQRELQAMSTEHQEVPAPQGEAAQAAEPDAAEPQAAEPQAGVRGEAVSFAPAAGGSRGRRGPVRRAGRLIARHKVISASIAAFAAAVIAVSVATSSSGARSYPAAHAFTVTALGKSGAKISLSQFKGKPLVLNFWASWCHPCQVEAPLLASWYKQQHGHVSMVGFAENDGTASALAFAHAKGMTYLIASDPLATVAGAYGVSGLGIPQTFFLNSQHRIVDHVIGKVTKADLAAGLRLMNAS